MDALKRNAAWLVPAAACYVAAGAIAALYLAAALYFLVLKTLPPAIDAGTFLALWDQLGAEPASRPKLIGAALAAGALVYGLPLAAIAGLARRPRPLHGAARFATRREVRQAGLAAEQGILVGRHGKDYLVFGGQQFALLAAPTRSGKGVGVVIPSCLNWPDSLVVLDVKLENFAVTSGFRAAHGQAVFLFNPFAADLRTHRWNPLDGVSRHPHFRVGDIQAIAQVFYPHDKDQRDAFWSDQAQNLFLGLVLYLMETPELPCTLGEVLRQGSGCGQPVDEHLRAILDARRHGPRALSASCIDALDRFVATSENTLASIKATFDAPLTIFANPVVDAATSSSDFDLRDLRRQRMTVYVGIQLNRLASASRLVNLFFAQLVNVNTESLPAADPTLKHQVLLILDEFTALGRVTVLAKSVAFLAGYNLRLLPIIQSIAQLESVYGREDTRNFVANHDVQIVFPPREQKDANEISEMLGYFTERATSTGQSRSAGFGRAASHSRSENVSEQRRALLLPQEVKELGEDRAIVFKTNAKPILAEKIRYYEDPRFVARVFAPVVVPPIEIGMHPARSARSVPDAAPGGAGSRATTRAAQSTLETPADADAARALDVSALNVDAAAIAAFTGDPQRPTPEEAAQVVESFFEQLQWMSSGDAAASAATASEADGAPPAGVAAAGGALELPPQRAPKPNARRTGRKPRAGPGPDLSALDR